PGAEEVGPSGPSLVRFLVGAASPRVHRRRHAGPPGHVAGPCGDACALVHERGGGHRPTLTDLTHSIGVRYRHLGKEHLVEAALPGHLAQRAHLDARRVHVADEVGEPGMLLDVGVRAGEKQATVRQMTSGGPHLLAGNDPAVAVANRPRREPGQVGPRPRLTEELAPNLFTRKERSQVPPLLLIVAVRRDGGSALAVAGGVHHVAAWRPRF